MKRIAVIVLMLCLLAVSSALCEDMEAAAELQYPNSLLFGLPEGPHNSCAILVDLPQDTVMVESVSFENGDYIQTFQPPDGVRVQILRYSEFDMTLADLAEGEWTGYSVLESLDVTGWDACVKDAIHLKADVDEGYGMASYDVFLLRAETGSPDQVHLMQVVFPSVLGEERIRQESKEMLDSVLVYPLDLIEWG